jgi:hypothetical protein
MNRILLFLTLFALILDLGCVNNVGHAGASSGPPPSPYPDIEQCYTNPTAPAGYIRINSQQELSTTCPQTQAGQLNILVFTPYFNLPVGSTLLVCADQQIPPGWIDVSGAYHDAAGCDAAAHPDSGFDNERTIYRTQ